MATPKLTPTEAEVSLVLHQWGQKPLSAPAHPPVHPGWLNTLARQANQPGLVIDEISELYDQLDAQAAVDAVKRFNLFEDPDL